MIRRAAFLLGIPMLIAALVAVPLGLWRGPYQWLCAGVAVGITVPPGLVTLWAVERFAKVSPFGRVIGLFVGIDLIFYGGAWIALALRLRTM